MARSQQGGFGGFLARVRVLVSKLPRARARIGPRRLTAGRAHQAVIRNGFEINHRKSKAARSSASLTAWRAALSFAFIPARLCRCQGTKEPRPQEVQPRPSVTLRCEHL